MCDSSDITRQSSSVCKWAVKPFKKVTASSKLCTKNCFHAIVLSQATGDNSVCQTGQIFQWWMAKMIRHMQRQRRDTNCPRRATADVTDSGSLEYSIWKLIHYISFQPFTQSLTLDRERTCSYVRRDSWCLILMSICHVQTIFSCLSPNPQSNQSFDQDYQTEMHLAQKAVQTEIYVFYVSHSHQTIPITQRTCENSTPCHVFLLYLLEDSRSAQLLLTLQCQTDIITVICIALRGQIENKLFIF